MPHGVLQLHGPRVGGPQLEISSSGAGARTRGAGQRVGAGRKQGAGWNKAAGSKLQNLIDVFPNSSRAGSNSQMPRSPALVLLLTGHCSSGARPAGRIASDSGGPSGKVSAIGHSVLRPRPASPSRST